MNLYLMRAIAKLSPNSQYTIKNDDYSTIEWHILEGDAPTQAEVNAAIEQIKTDEATEAEEKAEAKAAAEAKLEALGLTPEDLAALGL